MRNIVLLICLSLTGCLADDGPHIAFNDAPMDIGDGWSIANPEDVGMNAEALKQAYQSWFDSDCFRTAFSLIVIRHGKLIKEGYARDFDDRTRPSHVQSVTKSVVSLVMGIVRGLGYLQDLDQTLYQIMPEAFDGVEDEKRSITIRHLLTMSSGIDFDDGDTPPALEPHSGAAINPMNYLLKKPMYAKPGEEYRYRSTDSHLLSGAIQKASGKTLAQLADEHLFSPLRIEDFHWQTDTDGHSTGGWGLFMRPRDMGKIGQLVLQGGIWNDQRIVPEEWINQATIPQCQVHKDEERYKEWEYGYYWWIYTELEANAAALGHGGQVIFVFPEKDLVIVHTAQPQIPNNNKDFCADFTEFKFKEIIAAILNSM